MIKEVLNLKNNLSKKTGKQKRKFKMKKATKNSPLYNTLHTLNINIISEYLQTNNITSFILITPTKKEYWKKETPRLISHILEDLGYKRESVWSNNKYNYIFTK